MLQIGLTPSEFCKLYLIQWEIQFLNVEIHHIFLLSREFSLLILKETFQSFFENILIEASSLPSHLFTLVL